MLSLMPKQMRPVWLARLGIFHVTTALNIELDENLRMITESVAAAKARGHESMFDCEHYFDGYKANPDYALSCVQAAHQGWGIMGYLM